MFLRNTFVRSQDWNHIMRRGNTRPASACCANKPQVHSMMRGWLDSMTLARGSAGCGTYCGSCSGSARYACGDSGACVTRCGVVVCAWCACPPSTTSCDIATRAPPAPTSPPCDGECTSYASCPSLSWQSLSTLPAKCTRK